MVSMAVLYIKRRDAAYFLGERSPALSDRANMPYTMSVITELLRIDIARRSLPHYADKDVVIQGHTIPKGKLARNHRQILFSVVLFTVHYYSFITTNDNFLFAPKILN